MRVVLSRDTKTINMIVFYEGFHFLCVFTSRMEHSVALNQKSAYLAMYFLAHRMKISEILPWDRKSNLI